MARRRRPHCCIAVISAIENLLATSFKETNISLVHGEKVESSSQLIRDKRYSTQHSLRLESDERLDDEFLVEKIFDQ
jgi:pSer/pThr/pTyr-binding forkhead associated (FHA) protein